MKTLTQHNIEVAVIAKQLIDAKGTVVLKRNSSCCSRSFKYKTGKPHIDISKLNQILEINLQEHYAVVEPLVTMEQLARVMLPLKVIPPIVPEFRHMTIGGAILGLAGESSSCKHGLIDESVLEYELILGDGRVIDVNLNSHAELFHSLTGSHGSLGIVSKIKLKLVPATHYVRVQYQEVNSIEEVYQYFDQSLHDQNEFDFIEAIAVGKYKFCVAIGRKTDEISNDDARYNYCSLKHFFSPWYYCHILEKCGIAYRMNKKVMFRTVWNDFKYNLFGKGKVTPYLVGSHHEPTSQVKKSNVYEYLTYEDYLFRWDRGAFWMGIKAGPHILKHTILNRLIFGKMMTCKALYKNLHKQKLINRDKRMVLQDVVLPIKQMQDFFNHLDSLVNIYPLWLIPIKSPETKKTFSLPHDVDRAFVDFGVWGNMPRDKGYVDVNRNIEMYLRLHQGRKCFWAQCYNSYDEFWDVYDKASYDASRKKYIAEDKFVNIYDKVSELYRSLHNH